MGLTRHRGDPRVAQPLDAGDRRLPGGALLALERDPPRHRARSSIFFIAATAELNRPPFDLAEGESELGGGFHTEYSSIRFALFFLAEFMNTITMSAIVVTLFFGGPDGPGFHFLRWLWPILWFLGKTVVFLYFQVWIRAALPRLRYDQLMDLGWKVPHPALARLAARHRRRARSRARWGFAHRRRRASSARCSGRRVQVAPASSRRRRVVAPALGRPATCRRLAARRRAATGEAGEARWLDARRSLGLLRRLRAGAEAGRRAAGHHAVPEGEAAEAAAPARPPRPQPLRGRHGEVHRLRAVRRRSARPTASTCAARDNPPDAPVSPGERYGFVYEINYLRCIHCDLCVEACPTEAITESKLFEFSFTSRADAIYTKARARRRRRRPAPAPALGGLARGRGPAHLGVDAGDLAVGRRRPTRARCSGRASSATACVRPKAARAASATTRRRATSRSATVAARTRSRVRFGGKVTLMCRSCSRRRRSPTRSPSSIAAVIVRRRRARRRARRATRCTPR